LGFNPMENRAFWRFSRLNLPVGRKWCPEEDSNLHGLATAST
jgi:hypothetical protein